MQELEYIGRYGDTTIHLAYCAELDQLVQMEETEDINNPDAILLNGFVCKIKDNQKPILFGTK